MKDYGIVLMKNLPKIMNERGTFCEFTHESGDSEFIIH